MQNQCLNFRVAFFDDRIQIDNPGLLRFGLTIPDIKQGISKLRNRIIWQVFHAIGLIERWGSGIQRIVSTCEAAGFKPPHFEELGTHFRVTLHTTHINAPTLDTLGQRIVSTLKKHNQTGLTTKQIATVIKLTPRATRTRLIKLVDMGLIIEVGSSPQDPNRVYFAR